ncbi:Fusarisetin A cluster transcription factor fsa6 [Lachnellula suecica]|uniref:Fusarisetin A cluster transcription factor fsa6 n=1 Tax=Lachnellula suecica TaxID=602035 RepID=A0A8T9CM52_9HELO|nr:Fusarisetin A cluster transcription factor fsa6 [Lachnellula suecica]
MDSSDNLRALNMSAPPESSSTATPSNPDSSRKRARPTKSCLECRRKKLKCDRIQPCLQCKKLGREALCTYATGPSGSPNPANEDVESSRKRPKVDVSRLNTWVGGNSSSAAQGYSGEASRTESGNGHIQGSTSVIKGSSTTSGQLHVRGSRSRYIGPGDRMALLDHFGDEKSFIISSFTDSELSRSIAELATFQKAFHPKTKPSRRSSDERATLITEMLNSLPEYASLEALKERYLVNMETLLRVMHIPTFRRQCAEIQDSRTSLSTAPRTNEPILAQLLAAISIATRLSDSTDNKATIQELSDDQVASYLTLIQKWLHGLKGKERLNIDCLRAQALLLIAKAANLFSLSELWKESGTLVRTAMTMGLHRDAEFSSDLPCFEKEQRRKLWLTIIELDMQFSLALGMPTAIQSSDFNIRKILHVDDEVLMEDMPRYPVEKPVDSWSDALPQILLQSAVKPRLDAINMLARDIDISQDTERIVILAKELESGLRSLLATLPKQSKKQHRVFSDITLDMHLRRPSLALYQAVSLSDHASQYPEARKGALRCSVAILSHLDALDPAVADIDTIKSNDYLNFFHVLFRNDIIQSALLLCHEIRAMNLPMNTTAPKDLAFTGGSADPSTPWTKHSLTRLVENTLRNYLQQLGEFGSDLKTIMPLSVILQSVRSDGTPEEKRELMIKGTERVLRACRKVLPLPIAQETSPPNGNPPNAPVAQTPVANISTGGAPTPKLDSWHSGLLMPFASNTNSIFDPNGNVDPDLQNFDIGFSDWDMMGQSWF